MPIRRPLRDIVLLAAMAPFIAAVAAPNAPSNDVLVIRTKADIRTTDPGVNRDANTDGVIGHLVEGLVAFRQDLSIAPMLAQSIDVSADGKTYLFKLRPGLRFSNGAPLTSDDVLFAWRRYMTPETGWRCLTEFDGRGLSHVIDVKASGPLAVAFTLAQPSPLFLSTLARIDCGGTGIYHRSSIGPDGKWLQVIGTGPFKLAEWKRNQYIDLARNDFYSALPGIRDGNAGNKTPQVNRVRFLIIPDGSAARAAFLAGAVDVIPDILDEDMGFFKAQKTAVMSSSTTMSKIGLLIQTRDPVLKDVRIRRALALSLDIPELVDAVTNGTSQPSRSAIPGPSAFYGRVQSDLPKRDLATARRLLAEAGYNRRPIKLLTTKAYANLFNLALMSQAMAEETGLVLELEVLDPATVQDRYLQGKFQVMALAYSPRQDASLSYEMFTGSKDKDARKVWDNPAAIDLVTQSMQVTDRPMRQALFDRLERMVRDDVPAIWLYSEVRTAVSRPGIQGYASWPLGTPRAWGVKKVDPKVVAVAANSE